jgi:hypothetical protein
MLVSRTLGAPAPMAALVLGLVAPVALVACSGASTAGPDPAEAGASAAPEHVTFTQVYGTVLGSCTSCHAGIIGQFDGLDMSTQATAYKNLVGVKASNGSCASRGEMLVVAGSSATSLLYKKLTSPDCGSTMPQNAPPLSQASLDLIKAWIDEGAPND